MHDVPDRIGTREVVASVLEDPIQNADQTRRLAQVGFDSTPAEALAGDSDAAGRVRDTALVLLAADAFGGASRLVRDSVIIFEGKVGSLRRFKDDVAEVQQGFECGIAIANFSDVKIGDVIEAFELEELEAKL